MGSLYRRGRTFWAKYREGSRIVRVSTGTSDRLEAERFLAHREPKVANRADPKFEDLVTLVESDYLVNGYDTLEKLKERVRLHLEPFFRQQRISRVAENVAQYIAKRQADGAASATVNRELAIIRRGFKLAWRQKLVPAVPYVPVLKERNARQGFFEREVFEQVRRLLPAHHQPAATFGYITGWRMRSEVLTRQWRHVDFVRELVILEAGEAKTEEPRVFPFTPTLRAVLLEQRASAPADCPWVFYRTDRREIARWGYQIHDFVKSWRRACRSAGVPRMLKHDFRRTAVRNLINAGVPERDAMLMVGWKSQQMCDRYNIRSLGDLRRAAELLDRAQSGHSDT